MICIYTNFMWVSICWTYLAPCSDIHGSQVPVGRKVLVLVDSYGKFLETVPKNLAFDRLCRLAILSTLVLWRLAKSTCSLSTFFSCPLGAIWVHLHCLAYTKICVLHRIGFRLSSTQYCSRKLIWEGVGRPHNAWILQARFWVCKAKYSPGSFFVVQIHCSFSLHNLWAVL